MVNADLKKKAEPYRLCPDDPAEGNACSTHTHTHTHTHTVKSIISYLWKVEASNKIKTNSTANKITVE